MDSWGRSTFTDKIAKRLVREGLLRPVTDAARPEWIIPVDDDEMHPPLVMS
jgi:hypothetical protein